MSKYTRRDLARGVGSVMLAGPASVLASKVQAALAAPVVLANRFVRARFSATEAGVHQEYFARDPGGKWVLLASSVILPNERPKTAAPLFSDQGQWQRFRLLNANLFDTVRRIKREGQ